MTVLIMNLKRIFKKPINIILMILVPVLLNLFFISVSTQETKYTIGLINHDDTKLTKMIMKNIESQADIVDIEDNQESIQISLIDTEIDMALKIEKDYTKKIMNGEDGKFLTYSVKENNKSEPIRILIESLTKAAREIGRQAKGDQEKFYKAMEEYLKGSLKTEYTSFEFTESQKVDRAKTSLGFLAMGMMFLMTFATTLLVEDRELGVYSRMATTPVSKTSYILQHLLSYIIVAIVQIILIFTIIPRVVEISYGSSMVVIIKMMLVTLLFAGVGITIGLTISRFAKSATVVSALISLINLPILMLGGALWPREIMPETVQRIGDFIPVTWYLQSAENILYGFSFSTYSKEIVLMAAIIVVLLIVSLIIKTDEQ